MASPFKLGSHGSRAGEAGLTWEGCTVFIGGSFSVLILSGFLFSWLREILDRVTFPSRNTVAWWFYWVE